MRCVYGRRTLLEDLAELLLGGRTVLLYGPMGSGKSAILEALVRVMEVYRRPCGFSQRTQSLSDITGALLAAYPEVPRRGRAQREIRSALTLAIEAEPGALLLDHLGDPGTQFKGFLRFLRGNGLGVLMAADVEVPRDHERLRAMRLAYQEIEVPPLPSRTMHRILADVLSGDPLPFALQHAEKSALMRIARGRAGWIVMASRLLRDAHYWRDGRIRKESLRAEIMSQIMGRYVAW